MEQLVVLDTKSNKEFYLELVANSEVPTVFAFFSKDALDHRMFSEVKSPRYKILKGDINNPVAQNINSLELVNCNDYPEKF